MLASVLKDGNLLLVLFFLRSLEGETNFAVNNNTSNVLNHI